MPDPYVYGGFRSVWLYVMFDLPVETPEDRKHYRQFRDFVLTEGFSMTQYSIYVRFCATSEHADAHEDRIAAKVPPEGEVRILRVTTAQHRRQRIVVSGKRRGGPDPPSQLAFF